MTTGIFIVFKCHKKIPSLSTFKREKKHILMSVLTFFQ